MSQVGIIHFLNLLNVLDLNKVALVLRFDEINYKELLKNKLEPYYDKVIKIYILPRRYSR